MNSQIGLVDQEINNLTKLLFVGTLILSLILTAIKVYKLSNQYVPYYTLNQGFSGEWHITLIRFILLFSYIIPIRYTIYYLCISKNY